MNYKIATIVTNVQDILAKAANRLMALKDGKDIPLKKGDRVLYGGYSSDEFEIDNEKFIIVEYKDILGKFE